MQITYRLGNRYWGEQEPEKIPILSIYIEQIDEEFFVDLETLAEALKPFLKNNQ